MWGAGDEDGSPARAWSPCCCGGRLSREAMGCGLGSGLQAGRTQALGEDGPSTARDIWQGFAVESGVQRSKA